MKWLVISGEVSELTTLEGIQQHEHIPHGKKTETH